MEQFIEKKFTVLDPGDMKTLAFVINKEQEGEEQYCSLQKLECSTEKVENGIKKTFFISNNNLERDDLVLLTLGNGKAMLNAATLQNGKLFVEKEPGLINYKMLSSNEPTEYKDIKYTPNFSRPITIIDPEIGDEIKPVLYIDNEVNEVRAKVKMLPNKSYIAIAVKQ